MPRRFDRSHLQASIEGAQRVSSVVIAAEAELLQRDYGSMMRIRSARSHRVATSSRLDPTDGGQPGWPERRRTREDAEGRRVTEPDAICEKKERPLSLTFPVSRNYGHRFR